MTRLLDHIRKKRRVLGLSQAELSRLSGVSLPTIQNIERGGANPSLSTLQSLLEPLGLRLIVDDVPADWDALISCGLPMLQETTITVRPSRPLLIETLRRVLSELHRHGQKNGRQDNRVHDHRAYDDRVYDEASQWEYERKRESVHALLLALKNHYGSVFDKNFAKTLIVKEILNDRPTGRILKLRRIALSRLAEYL